MQSRSWPASPGPEITLAKKCFAHNVQKRSRCSSSCFAMIITEHSAESLTPFDSGVEFADGPERPQQAVF
jgi:hypothetical protein